MVLLVKNIKLQLRYDGVREKSMAKINTNYQLTLFAKMFGNLIFPILLPTQTTAYIIYIALFTVIGCIIVTKNVIFENPKI